MSCSCGTCDECCRTEHQYAVKVVCGTVPECGPSEQHPPVAPGMYFTAINIHNPSKCDRVTFRWKVAQANPGKPGKVSGFQDSSLGPDEAVEIDCEETKRLLNIANLTFLKGYVVLESAKELDVVAVYSGTQGPNWPLNTFHTERVPSRCVPVCEDLTLPLNTGVADWRVVTTGNLVVNLLPANTNGTPPLGSQWVSEAQTDGSIVTGPPPAKPPKEYQVCFKLCSGFVPANTSIAIKVDDKADIFLNNSQITPIAGVSAMGTAPPVNVTLPGNLLKAGENCLRVKVTNSFPTKTGFAIAGLLRIARGRCCGALPLLPPARLADVSPQPIDDVVMTSETPQITKTNKRRKTKKR